MEILAVLLSKPMQHEVYQALYETINICLQYKHTKTNHLSILEPTLSNKSKDVSQAIEIQNFEAHSEWLYCFHDRNSIA